MPLPRAVGLDEAAEGSVAPPRGKQAPLVEPRKKAASAAAPKKVAAPADTSTPAKTATPRKKVAVMASTSTPKTSADWLMFAKSNSERLLREAVEFRIAALSVTPAQVELMMAHVPDELKQHLPEFFASNGVVPAGAPATSSVAGASAAPAGPVVPEGDRGPIKAMEGEVQAYHQPGGLIAVYKGDEKVKVMPEAEFDKNKAKIIKELTGKKATGISGRFNF